MVEQGSVEVPDRSLVSWRRQGEGDFAPGLVNLGLVWPLPELPGIDGDPIRACLLARESGIEHLVSLVTGVGNAHPLQLQAVELGPPVP